jgi:hypothetical protein
MFYKPLGFSVILYVGSAGQLSNLLMQDLEALEGFVRYD